MLIPSFLPAQRLDSRTEQYFRLKEGIEVKLFSTVTEPAQYYYIPMTLQLSTGKKNNPEVSLLLYRDRNQDVTGGILHALFTWGLKPEQEAELRSLLVARDSAAVLAGPATITLSSGRMECNQNDSFASGLLAASQLQIKIPVEAIHKTAASFNLSPDLAAQFHRYLTAEQPTSGSMLFGYYHFSLWHPAQSGKVAVDTEEMMRFSLRELITTIKEFRLIKYVNL